MKKLILSLCLLLYLVTTNAQDIPGYNTSNYAGISGFHLNPASIADSRYKFDMNLIGGGISVYNNYVGVQRQILRDNTGGDLQQKYMREGVNSNRISVNNQNYLQLPSFMISLSSKASLAFNFRARTLVNLDRINPELARMAYYGLDIPALYNLRLENDRFSLNSMVWSEYGLGYAQVLKGQGNHFLKVGGQAKLITGIAAAYFYARDLNYSWKNKDTLSVFQSNFGYGHSDNFEFTKDNLAYKHITKPSLGFDIGAVYEFRPNYKKYLYDLDGEKDLERRDLNKYLFRVGVSLLDIGRVKFQKAPNSNDFSADIRDWDVNNLQFGDNPVKNFNDTIRRRFNMDTSETTFNMALPTALSIQVDYHMHKGFYLNFTSYVSPRFITDESKVHSLSYYRITPRWDSKWLGLYVPMGLNGYGQFNLGTAVRLGPLVVGSSNVGNFFVGKYITGADIHFALKIPIYYGKPKDRDKDKVSNRRDQCPKVPGTWETRGCPDKDGDFIADAQDKCPDVRGVAELKGCPDADRDGITDGEDNCPESPGTLATNGCPDIDEDGIIDLEDKCVDVAGPKELKGCPDTDSDGTNDLEDNCPNVSGPVDNNGCPYGDMDKDGTPDKDDRCPELAGEAANYGCPDTDKDGIFDFEDNCPQTAGPAINKGCPVIEEEEKEVINTAFKNLEYEASSANLLPTSYPTLDELAKLLKSKPDWKLKIAGHTDSSGNEQINLDLSRRRALTVKTYLVNLGIDENRITTEFYGSSKPVDTNSTAEGRQRNRRVEMEVVFD